MSKRTRIHPVQFYLNDDEQYILEEKYRLSRMKSKSAFLRKMVCYNYGSGKGNTGIRRKWKN